MNNRLYFGDCLDVLKVLHKEYPQGFIDLIYIDPPFNSKRNYNILFENVNLKDTKAQREAFADTWSNVSYNDTLLEIQELDYDLYQFIHALDMIKISKSAISYLTTMAIRIWYIHRVLKDTGSFYLHCDPNMSHYLKLVCDLVFGKENFKNEIIWRRTGSHNKTRRCGPIHDVILFYSKSKIFTWNFIKKFYMKGHIKSNFIKDDKGMKTAYYGNVLTGSGLRNGESGKEWRGFNPSDKGRHWAVPGALLEDIEEDISELTQHQKLDRLFELGYIKIIEGQAWPIYERYLSEKDGQFLSDIWAYQPYTNGCLYNSDDCIDEDVRWLSTQDKERLGYPTQKPEGLLERIISSSSNEGDLVADFFCGCGTTIAAANKLNRKWLGTDISHLAIRLILDRLAKPYDLNPESREMGKAIRNSIEVHGFPRDIDSAKELARKTDKHRAYFQDWIIEVKIGGISNQKKSGDGGFDGYITFLKTLDGKTKGRGLIEVKSGNIGIATLKSFIHVVDKEEADMGIFVCFEEQVTSGMRVEANHAGKIENFSNFDKIQIITVEDLLEGREPRIPKLYEINTFKTATEKSNYIEDKQDAMF